MLTHVYLDTPLSGGTSWVSACFENGKWVVKQGQSAFGRYPAPADYPVLQGWVMWCKNEVAPPQPIWPF
jgi:hypothetical protein